MLEKMKKGNDILENPVLKENPFTAPEGYFDSLGERMTAAALGKKELASPARRLAPYFAYAAVLAFLVVAGSLFLRNATSLNEEFTSEALAYNDVVEYLIYIGTSLEEIELNQ